MFEATRSAHLLADRITQTLLVAGIVVVASATVALGVQAAHLQASPTAAPTVIEAPAPMVAQSRP